mmetsp:Transcript_15042/g.20927  ORF Transcript_15042/g.20927 Transcript_15042/m.20927 type:complete len:241 (+) Transcript_15042:93-815(+)
MFAVSLLLYISMVVHNVKGSSTFCGSLRGRVCAVGENRLGNRPFRAKLSPFSKSVRKSTRCKGKQQRGSQSRAPGRALTTLCVISISQHSKKNHWCDNACEEYTRRLSGYDGAKFGLEEVILKPAPGPPKNTEEQQKIQEGESLLARVEDGDYLFVLDERGKSISTLELAEEIRHLSNEGIRRIAFAIGGSAGHSDKVRKKANKLIKVSDMVLNHLIARALLVEQLYRVATILLGVPYHK